MFCIFIIRKYASMKLLGKDLAYLGGFHCCIKKKKFCVLLTQVELEMNFLFVL